MSDRPDVAEVAFTPSGRRGTVRRGSTVLDVARSLGVDLDSVCGGLAICGRCQVLPVARVLHDEDELSSLTGLSPLTGDEERYRRRKGLAPGRRLGCMARIAGDVVLDVPPESQLHRQIVRKRVEVSDVTLDPVIRLHYVTVAPADLDDPSGDAQRLLRALAEQWELTGLVLSPAVLGDVQTCVRAEDGMTVAVRDEATIVAAWPGFRDSVLGVAFDVGSTTIAGHLCELLTGETLASAGMMNPQIRYGEDLMSRVSYVMLHTEGAEALTEAVRGALDGLVGELVGKAGRSRDEVLELTLVGNPIMHHLVFGLDVRPLGEAPFAPATTESLEVAGSVLGLDVHPGARVHALPCIAGHVGADAAAAILSEAPHRAEGVQLLVDVGTNAEIVLGGRDRLLAASSPTGPAFEGAQISAGQRATAGAIERVRIDRESLEPRLKVIGCDVWSDDPGFAEAVDSVGVSGICGSGIIEAVAELFLTGLILADGAFAADAPDRTARIERSGRTLSYRLTDSVEITQNDIRAIQLAKAALYAGARLLMDHMGIDQVDQIRLAGAFGSHIDPLYAMVLGLIPDCDLEKVSAAGNAAGMGAVIALLDGASRTEIDNVVRKVEKIETAVAPRFQEHFVAAMGLPHSTIAFPHLAGAVELPPGTVARRGRRRARRDDS